MIEAQVVCDSIAQASRLHTQRWTYPKFVHQESLRHRQIYFMDFLQAEFDADFSFSVSSSRAIPSRRLIEEARSNGLRAEPVSWGAEQKGMSPGEELDDERKCVYWPDVVATLNLDVIAEDRWVTKRECIKSLWKLSANFTALVAQIMLEHGAHKSIINRQIEKDIHVHCLATATTNGWMNFFGLRLDRAADPTLRALAEAAWIGWNESEPKQLEPGQWHLPFVDEDDWSKLAYGHDEWLKQMNKNNRPTSNLMTNAFVRISVARSAHLSYESFSSPGARMTVEECVALHDRFVNSRPMQASLMEHQATPDSQILLPSRYVEGSRNPMLYTAEYMTWSHPQDGRNLGPGWRQYRAMLPNEAIAPLPEQAKGQDNGS